MVEAFLQESQSRVGCIRDGLNSLSLERLRDEAHTLKSLAGTFGALSLQGVAKEMEQACREGNAEAANSLGLMLEELFNETHQVYRKRFKAA